MSILGVEEHHIYGLPDGARRPRAGRARGPAGCSMSSDPTPS